MELQSPSSPAGTIPKQSRYQAANLFVSLENRKTPPIPSIRLILFPPDSNFVAVRIVKVRKLAFRRIFFDRIGQESFTFHRQQAPFEIFDAKYELKHSLNISSEHQLF